MQPVRLKMLHELLTAFRLHEKRDLMRIEEVSLSTTDDNALADLLTKWHADEYVSFLQHFSRGSFQASVQCKQVRGVLL